MKYIPYRIVFLAPMATLVSPVMFLCLQPAKLEIPCLATNPTAKAVDFIIAGTPGTIQ